MVNIPNKIKIGNYEYDVILTNEKLILDNRLCKGIIDYEFHNIKINNDIQDLQGQEQTFLHEVLHGIVKDRNLNFEDEEIVVDEIASALHGILKDNKNLFEREVQK